MLMRTHCCGPCGHITMLTSAEVRAVMTLILVPAFNVNEAGFNSDVVKETSASLSRHYLHPRHSHQPIHHLDNIETIRPMYQN